MIPRDARQLLRYMDDRGIDASTEVTRGWTHIGAVIVDAVLQRRQKYKATVYPRVQNLVEVWPDVDTVSGFRARMAEGDLGVVIRWRGQERLTQIQAIVDVLASEPFQIETVADLRAALTPGRNREALRGVLSKIRHVGPKTLDYLDILVGLSTGTAVDSRILKHMKSAGVSSLKYAHVQEVMRAAADRRGWRHGDLDAALWNA